MLLSKEGKGFEPLEPEGSAVFKTAAIDHSANPPNGGSVLPTDNPEPHKFLYLTITGMFTIRGFLLGL